MRGCFNRWLRCCFLLSPSAGYLEASMETAINISTLTARYTIFLILQNVEFLPFFCFIRTAMTLLLAAGDRWWLRWRGWEFRNFNWRNDRWRGKLPKKYIIFIILCLYCFRVFKHWDFDNILKLFQIEEFRLRQLDKEIVYQDTNLIVKREMQKNLE